jgi:hypothetical protein
MKWGIRLFWGGVLMMILALFIHWGLQKVYPALRGDWFVMPPILCMTIGGWMYLIGKVWNFLTDKKRSK